VRGDIASGDQVIASGAHRARIRSRVPSALAVEMEGAAVAQVCLERGVRFACVRMISDIADENVEASFGAFIPRLAGAYTAGIIGRWLGASGRERVH
jgi:adenosylhomocysteine nucleosidase